MEGLTNARYENFTQVGGRVVRVDVLDRVYDGYESGYAAGRELGKCPFAKVEGLA